MRFFFIKFFIKEDLFDNLWQVTCFVYTVFIQKCITFLLTKCEWIVPWVEKKRLSLSEAYTSIWDICLSCLTLLGCELFVKDWPLCLSPLHSQRATVANNSSEMEQPASSTTQKFHWALLKVRLPKYLCKLSFVVCRKRENSNWPKLELAGPGIGVTFVLHLDIRVVRFRLTQCGLACICVANAAILWMMLLCAAVGIEWGQSFFSPSKTHPTAQPPQQPSHLQPPKRGNDLLR